MINRFTCVVFMGAVALVSGQASAEDGKNWRINTAKEWNGAARQVEGLAVNDGLLSPVGKEGVYRSSMQRFKEKRSAQTLTLAASVKWENWEPTAKRVVPPTIGDAPIFFAKGPGDYWLLSRYKRPRRDNKNPPKAATLDGFDVPLKTPPFIQMPPLSLPGGFFLFSAA